MKTQQRRQTHTLLFLLLMLFTASCVGIFKKKDKDPEPQLAGTYTISTYRVTLGTQTIPGSSGTVLVTGPTNNQIDITFNLTGLGSFDSDNVEVRKNGGSYDMYDGTTKVGSINGTDFSIDAQGADSNGQFVRLQVTAKK